MNVFIAGATGVLGRRLVAQMAARGHSVAALVRSREGERAVAALGGQPRYADLFDAAGLVHAAKGAEVIIHAATAIPTKPAPAPADWTTNDRIRREGTEALARCAGQIGAKTFVFQSIVWVAVPPDGSEFNEESPPRPNAITQSALDGEGIAQEMAKLQGFAATVLRCGMFYGADAAHTRMMAAGLAKRRLPVIGRGDNFWHCLHVDDAASGFVAAAEAGRAGLWHLVDNEPVPVRELLQAMAQRLGARPPRRLPAWLARLVAGGATVDFFMQSTRTSNARFRRDFGWSPKYPTFREGLDQVLGEWQGRVPA
jgi:nucleoside-diphosphate-sugar epimerase